MLVPFGEWTPDQPDLGTAMADANNVIPAARSYRPWTTTANYSTAIAARCQGATSGSAGDGTVFTFAGDIDSLYRLSGTTWNELSKPGGYTTGAEETWRFVQFGQKVIATNGNDPIQSFSLGATGTFLDLATAAPKARHMALIDPGFLMVGNLVDSSTGAAYPNRVQWPAIEDPTNWPPAGSSTAVAVQSDYQDLPNGGWVQNIIGPIGGAAGAVFMERSIYRIQYEGPPTQFGFYEVERARGTPAPNSIANVGPMAFYLGEDGFYGFDGQQSTPIGANKVDKFFFADLNQSYFSRIYAAADPINKIVVWVYPSTASSDGTLDSAIIFNWQVGKWSSADFSGEFLFRGLSQGYFLDDMDTFGTLDAMSQIPLDSRVWLGGRLLLSAFDGSHRLAYFTGSALEATLTSGEFSGQDHDRVFVSGVRPVVDGGTPTVAIGYRSTPSGTVTYGSDVAAGADGVSPQRISARYVRAKVKIPAASTWSHAIGIEPRMKSDGRR